MVERASDILSTIKPGAILEFWSPDRLGRVIEFYVRGRSQHVGLVAKHIEDHRLLAWESTMSLPTPCIFTGKRVKGVGARLLDKRLEYTLKCKGRIWVHPLVMPLTDDESQELAWACYRTRGTPYDWRGAIECLTFGRRRWTRVTLPSKEDAGKLVCCEAVAFWLRVVGRFKRDNAAAFNPVSFLEAQHQDKIHRQPFEVMLEMFK